MYMGGHFPYNAPGSYKGAFLKDLAQTELTRRLATLLERNEISENQRANFKNQISSLSKSEEWGGDGLDYLVARYDERIAYTDQEMARVLDYLKTSQLDKNTIVVFTADHGESSLEHGLLFHSTQPYNELVHVPLVVFSPTFPEGTRRITSTVELIDIYPTVIDLLGLQEPKGIQGVSLLPAITGAADEKFAFCSYGPLVKLIT